MGRAVEAPSVGEWRLVCDRRLEPFAPTRIASRTRPIAVSIARILLSVSAHSLSGTESSTIPAAGLHVRHPLGDHARPDRDREVHPRAPRARCSRRRPPYAPRRSGSSSSMISIARTFGAPVIVPAGKVARNASSASSPVAQLAVHLAHEVEHVRVPLDDHVVAHLHACRTARRARCRSGRGPPASRARRSSFSSPVSSATSSASCSGVAPRGRVPAIGRTVARAAAHAQRAAPASCPRAPRRRARGGTCTATD